MGIATSGQPAVESHSDPNTRNPRHATETAAAAIAEKGASISIVRHPPVYNTQKQGIIIRLIHIARDKGCSAYFGEGSNRWAAAHISDVAKVYWQAPERTEPGRYHAVAEEGITSKSIPTTIGKG